MKIVVYSINRERKGATGSSLFNLKMKEFVELQYIVFVDCFLKEKLITLAIEEGVNKLELK